MSNTEPLTGLDRAESYLYKYEGRENPNLLAKALHCIVGHLRASAFPSPSPVEPPPERKGQGEPTVEQLVRWYNAGALRGGTADSHGLVHLAGNVLEWERRRSPPAAQTQENTNEEAKAQGEAGSAAHSEAAKANRGGSGGVGRETQAPHGCDAGGVSNHGKGPGNQSRVAPTHAAHGPGVFWSTCDGCMFEKLNPSPSKATEPSEAGKGEAGEPTDEELRSIYNQAAYPSGGGVSTTYSDGLRALYEAGRDFERRRGKT